MKFINNIESDIKYNLINKFGFKNKTKYSTIIDKYFDKYLSRYHFFRRIYKPSIITIDNEFHSDVFNRDLLIGEALGYPCIILYTKSGLLNTVSIWDNNTKPYEYIFNALSNEVGKQNVLKLIRKNKLKKIC